MTTTPRAISRPHWGILRAEQKRTLANLLLAAIDYPEDLEIHLERGILHTGSGFSLIPANRRLADAAAPASGDAALPV